MSVLCRLSLVTAISYGPLCFNSRILVPMYLGRFLVVYGKIHQGWFGQKRI